MISENKQNMVVQNNKRIAKNTLILYVRMLFSMIVSLYTSRVVLQVLGVEDYGIQSVVGGVITMFTFINGSMISSTQRYLNFAIGKNDSKRLQSIFSTSLQIHGIIALIILLLGETVGLWFLYEKLIIPEERMVAAFWVYQCSVMSCIVSILSTPYNADIIAHEKMSAFAYISILEVSLKLVIVYLLLLSPFDKLIVYSILILLVQLLVRFIYTKYCHKHFNETYFSFKIDKSLFKEMFGFAGWSFWGNLAVIFYTQGLNMMLNIFFGPVVNAARGIAVQVQSAVQQFVGGFQTALNPQITKTYAVGELEQMHKLMFRSAKFSFFLLFFISLPVLLETHFLLTLWLKTVPENTVIFTRIMICISLIYTTANPLVIANQATGKVKKYQAVVGGILLMILPVSYIALKLGAPAYSVFIVHLIIEAIAQFARIIMLRKMIKISVIQMIKAVYIPIILTVFISIILPLFFYTQFTESWNRLIFVVIVCIFSVGLSVLYLGLSKIEREFVDDKIFYLLKKNKQ